MLEVPVHMAIPEPSLDNPYMRHTSSDIHTPRCRFVRRRSTYAPLTEEAEVSQLRVRNYAHAEQPNNCPKPSLVSDFVANPVFQLSVHHVPRTESL